MGGRGEIGAAADPGELAGFHRFGECRECRRVIPPPDETRAQHDDSKVVCIGGKRDALGHRFRA